MKRFFLSLALCAFLLTACLEISYLPLGTPTAIAADSTPLPLPSSTPTLIPPTQAPDLGVSSEALRGLTVSLWHGLDGEQASLMAQMAAEFSLVNPWGLTVKVSGWQNLSGLEAAIRSAKTGSGLPELVLALPEQALAWDEESLLAPLNPYFSNPEFGFTQADLNDFPAGLWRQDDLDGRRLGLPAVRSTRLLFYNLSWARELGFKNAPETGEDLRKQACAANAIFRSDADESNDGYGGLVLDGDPWTAYSWFKAFGGDVTANGDFDFEQAQNEAALVFLRELRADGCAWIASDLSAYHHLAGRRALFISGSLSEIAAQNAAWRASGTSDEWTVIPFVGVSRAVVAYGPSFALFESSPARQLAGWLFMRWALSPENQARWASESGFLPVRVSALELVSNPGPQWSAATELLPQMGNYPQLADWRVARRVLGDGFYTFFVLDLPVQNVLAEMQKTVEQVREP
ncbi:MAG: extracellular solute-binding protein [Anaerolineales bacterium]|jgi:ABC-type glycerol-3-phosphate transport system substrate-binding protein|nr:extracellular solute-binding protein [Anaerolineales bacterium]